MLVMFKPWLNLSHTTELLGVETHAHAAERTHPAPLLPVPQPQSRTYKIPKPGKAGKLDKKASKAKVVC